MFPMRLVSPFLVLMATFTLNAAERTTVQISDEEQAIVNATNKEREKAGLPPLAPSEKLFTAARKHSANMAAQQILSHELDRRSPSDRVNDAGYAFFEVGENVAWNQPDAASVVDGWMHSPQHRANILNKDFTEIGVGIAHDADGKPFYTQVFARPQIAAATATASFSITNNTTTDISIKSPGLPGSTLGPGESETLTFAGTGKFPKIEIQSGDAKRVIDVKDGVNFVIQNGEQGMEVKTTVPAR